MENLLNISLTGWIYPVMYLAAFTAGVSFILIEAKRNKWPMDSIALMLGCTILAAVIGSKIVMIPPDLILKSISAGQLPAASGKSFLGGAAGGVIGMLIAIRILRLPLEVGDKVALVLPVSLALGRIGCLFAGCCFGTVTGAPWGITYSAGSPAYVTHIHSGLIEPGSLTSLAVHPVPLYEILFCFVILAVVPALGKHLRRPGNRMLAVLALYSFMRFGGEFYRYQFQESFLSAAQAATALAAVTLLAVIIYRENRSGSLQLKPGIPQETKFILLVTLWIGVILLKDWLSPVESMLVWSVLLMVTIYQASRMIYRVIQQNRFCRPALISAVPILYLVALPASTESDSTSGSYFQYGFGIFGGTYGGWDIDEGWPAKNDYGCTYYPDWDGMERSYRYLGTGASVEKVTHHTEREISTFGIRTTFGQSTTPAANTARRSLDSKKEAIVMFNPYVRYDQKNIGFGVGVHIGSSPARRLTAREGARGYLESGSVHFAPMLSLRLLPRDKLFLEGKLQDADPGSFPMMRTQFGGGVGFRANDQLGSFRAGLSDWGYYMESDIPVSNRIMLNGRFGFSREDENLIKSQNYLSVGLRYKP